MTPILVAHSIDWRGGILAGYLVRTSSGRPLGYLWATGATWHWRTPNGENHGERGTQAKALEVLIQIAELRESGRPTLTASIGDRVRWPAPKVYAASRGPIAPRPDPPPAPPPSTPQKAIVWGEEAGDVTATLDTLLQKEAGR